MRNQTNISGNILSFYKNLKIKMQATEMMLQVLAARSKFSSYMVDKTKMAENNTKIKAYNAYYKVLQTQFDKLYKLINEDCYRTLTDIEKIVFLEGYMRGLTIKQIKEKYSKLKLTESNLRMQVLTINSKLRKVQLDFFGIQN